MKIDLEYIEKIAKIITGNSLSEITLTQGDDMITVKREGSVITTAVPTQTISTAQVAVEKSDNIKVEENTAQTVKENKTITSPMVGAFYAAPAPGAKPFVKVGDTVSVGQVVCIVEAMKLMNEIESEVSGRVSKICVEDGQSVEYGQVLMYIE